MGRGLTLALLLALLVPALAPAVPVGREPRPDPRTVAAEPSHVKRVEPAIVALKIQAAPDAPSSVRLGSRRFASGVVFDPRGYAVSVSYVLVDAISIEAQLRDGRRVPARLAGLDLESGLGVVQLEGVGPWATAVLGPSQDVSAGALTATVGVDEDNELVYVPGSVQAVRRFSGFWEYMLNRAFMVAPGSPSWGGSVVVNTDGQVVGIASLRLGERPYINMAIPIETFVPIKDELIAVGRAVSRRPRPWLGLYTAPLAAGVVVDGFAPVGPAATAGFRRGDRILSVNGVAVGSQEEFYEQLWRGQVGDLVQVGVQRDRRVHVIEVRSMDRYRLLRPTSR
jgi:S1-C subfamily serine protease